MKSLKCNPIDSKRSYTIKVLGVVQGVGYRPYIYNKANFYNIKGWVSNQGSAVVMDIEGEKTDIKEFLLQIVKKPPCLARLEKVEVHFKEYKGYGDFWIKPSSVDGTGLKFISADVATCSNCLKEILDPHNLRYKYAFTNCTDCGPRYSITRELPYDRKNTTMDIFQMCPNCEKEYNDPTNRRFHAQPNCCPACGPTLRLLNNKGEDMLCNDPIDKTIDLLAEGKIVAIKGLGGYHLACDAENQEAIEVLRERKRRPHKPFAIMVKDIENAKQLCSISEIEGKILLSNKRPIVLLEKKENNILSNQIAPKMKRLGIMLPYMPLHHLIFQGSISYLVMTSGNRSSAPIEYENLQAIEKLGSIAEYFLTHNRSIHIPVEDSIVKVVNEQEVVVRRARGYTPFIFPSKAIHEILSLGAEEKSTFSLTQNQYGYMSQYLGDIKDFDSYANYQKAIEKLIGLLRFKPKIVAHDFNTSYLSSQYARNREGEKMSVQHHHAHMVSCMVEHNVFSPVIGVVFDGTGLGTDGRVWGGEFFVGTRESFIRVGHLRYVTIQGGNQAIRDPWRIAASYLYSINIEFKDVLSVVNKKSLSIVKQALEQHLNCYESSSMGRFFDCVAAILDICHEITYGAQAAIELENIADTSIEDDYPFYIEEQQGIYQIGYKSIILGVLRDKEKGLFSSIISAKFHNTIGNITIDLVSKISERYFMKDVVLSGGVFENNYLLLYVLKGLKERGLTVYYNHHVPTNDSGISVGQLAIVDAIVGR